MTMFAATAAFLVSFGFWLWMVSCPLLLVSCFSTTITRPSSCSSGVVWAGHHKANGGRRSSSTTTPFSSSSSSSWSLHVYFTGMDHFREADVMEQWLGARRHDDLTILPDSMLETTLFVGNLCEFVTDQDLSRLFTQARVTFLQFVPACVMRKADLTSLQYGFVTFPSVTEKEAAREQFHGYTWRGKRLKVEPIRDYVNTKTGKSQRVRIPERMVAYVSGSVKKPALSFSSSSSRRRASSSSSRSSSSSNSSTQNGAVMNTMRRATAMVASTSPSIDITDIATKKDVVNGNGLQQHPTTTQKNHRDFTLPAQGGGGGAQQQQQQQHDYRKVLNLREQAEYARAVKKGYVSFNGCRKKAGSTSSLAQLFQSWCNNDRGGKPNIRLYKATNGHAALDQVVIDLSPRCLYNRRRLLAEQQQQQKNDGDKDRATAAAAAAAAEMDVLQYRAQVVLAAKNHGMVFLSDDVNETDNEDVNDVDDDDEDDSNDVTTMQRNNSVNGDENNVQSSPPTYWQLAILNIGIFQGERSQCKALAKELAQLWEIPEQSLLNITPQQPKQGEDSISTAMQRSNSPIRSFRQDDDDDDDDDDDRLNSISNGRQRRRGIKTKGLSRHRTRGGGHRQSWY